MQQGMLFHTLYAPRAGVYVLQLSCRLSGELDLQTFERAWKRVVERHTILRSSFHWKDIEKPLQVVHTNPELPFTLLDWRDVPRDEQQQRLRHFLRKDEELPFDLSDAPLMRLSLIRLDEDVHEFIWTCHHLLLDGWSLSLVFKEVFGLYEAFRKDQEIDLDAPIPYSHYIGWLQQQDLKEAERFWRETLRGFESPTPLPIESRNAAAAQQLAPAYDEAKVRLSVETTAALQRLSRQQRVTLNSVMQSVWALLLAHYSGTDDVVFGAVVAGRPAELAGVEGMVGPFINTLPARIGVRWEAEIWEWIEEVQAAQTEARQYEYSPLMQVQGWSEVERGVPLFASILAFENFPINTSLKKSEASLELVRVNSSESVNYPIGVMASPGVEFLIGIYYDCRRFDAATIERLLGHLKVMLESIAVNPRQRVAEIPVLTAEERRQLLFEWNNVSNAISSDVCVNQLFEAQAERTPNATAVIFGQEQVSYRELNERANQLARHLKELGVGPEVIVGICVERGVEMVVGLLGILKAGGAYLPIDPSYPLARIAFMLEDAGVTVLLTQEKLTEVLGTYSGEIVYLDSEWEQIAACGNQNLLQQVTPDNLAYVIYTSGSTGLPKGVLIEHRNVCNLAQAQIEIFGIHSGSRTLQFSSISFDASVWEIFSTLFAGAALCLGTKEDMLPGAGLIKLLSEQAISIVTLPPSVVAALPAEGWTPPETIIVAGERCSAELPARWSQRSRFYNAYGPTEVTVCSSLTRCEGTYSSPPPIGHPLPNTQSYVLDQYLNPVPIGVKGELYVGGAGVGRGYLNRPQLTLEKFVPDPFAGRPGGRLYRTGDLARFLPDGNLEFVGRIDHQVKVRGFRIELGEIEAVLKEHPSIRDCAVLAREDIPGEKRLVAYVISSPDAFATSKDLRAWVGSQLPEYMIPQFWV